MPTYRFVLQVGILVEEFVDEPFLQSSCPRSLLEFGGFDVVGDGILGVEIVHECVELRGEIAVKAEIFDGVLGKHTFPLAIVH